MTKDTRIILKELAVVEAGISMIITQQDAILEHLGILEPNGSSSAQSAARYTEAINGIKKRLRDAGEPDEL